MPVRPDFKSVRTVWKFKQGCVKFFTLIKRARRQHCGQNYTKRIIPRSLMVEYGANSQRKLAFGRNDRNSSPTVRVIHVFNDRRKCYWDHAKEFFASSKFNGAYPKGSLSYSNFGVDVLCANSANFNTILWNLSSDEIPKWEKSWELKYDGPSVQSIKTETNKKNLLNFKTLKRSVW